MKSKQPPASASRPELDAVPCLYQSNGETTQTIDLNSLFADPTQVTEAFDLRQVQHDSFGKLLQALSVPTLLVNRSHEIEFANAAFFTIIRNDHFEAQGEKLPNLFPEAGTAGQVRRMVEKVFDNRKPEVTERVVRVHNSRIWARMHFRTMRLGAEPFVLVQIENLTAQKQLLTVQKYRKLVNILPVAIVEFSIAKPLPCNMPAFQLTEAILAARVVDGNNAFANMHRRTTIGDLVGVPLKTLFPLRRRSSDIYEKWVGSSFLPYSFESREASFSKEIQYFENTLLGNVNNHCLLGFWWLKRDISERKRTEEEMMKSQKLESLGILAGGIAHDFNNLLTGILGNISLAQKYLPPEHKAWSRLNAAAKASKRAQGLTRQLLTFSRGGAPIRKTASIGELLKDFIAFALRGSKVRCDLTVANNLHPVDMDEAQMNQVINNLIINAVQAMPEGGTIRVRADNFVVDRSVTLPLRAGKYVRISVRDSGTGILPENMQKIFDPYFTTKEKGTGLGLATSYSIVRKHDGVMTVRSRVGVGTVFYIYLPASTEANVESCPQELTTIRGNGKILVMDDESLIRDLAGELLVALGYHVVVAREGAEAVALYREAKEAEAPFDLVIMDLTVPGAMGGKEAILELRRYDPGVKAVVSSGYSNDEVMAEFQDYGFVGVLPKPYDTEQVGRLLHELLGSDR
jgi:two-component system, cell cycle sensor histidine kinase and response regulator CckA